MPPNEEAASFVTVSEAQSTLTSDPYQPSTTNSGSLVAGEEESSFLSGGSTSSRPSNNSNNPFFSPRHHHEEERHGSSSCSNTNTRCALSLRALVYAAAVVAVLTAAHGQRASQRELRRASAAAHQALRLAAVSYVEGQESVALEREAEGDAAAAQSLEAAAETAHQEAALDEVHATRAANRERYYHHVAQQEYAEAERLFGQIQDTEAEILQVEHNLSADEAAEATLEEQLARDQQQYKSVHPRLCDDNAVFEAVCSVVGGTVDLEHDQDLIDEEKLKLLQENEELDALAQREYMQQLVAGLLHDRAAAFNKTALYLQNVTRQWEAQAARDQATAEKDEAAAVALEEQEARVEERLKREQDWRVRNRAAAAKLWQRAAASGRRAYQHAFHATLLAVVAGLYFLPRVCQKAMSLLRTAWRENQFWNDDDAPRQRTWWHMLSYAVVHALLFLLVTGLVDADYLLYLDTGYDLFQRAVIITWFSYLVAGLQTVLLHCLPHCWAEYRRACSVPRYAINFQDVALQFLLRLAFTWVFCVMEFLILWLTVRDTLFTAGALRLLGAWYVRYASAVVLVLHIVVLEQPPQMDIISGATTDQSTVLLRDDNDDEEDEESNHNNVDDRSEVGSELSPLCGGANAASAAAAASSGHYAPPAASVASTNTGTRTTTTSTFSDSSSSPTNDLPNIYFGNMQRAVDRAARRRSGSGNRLLSSGESTASYTVNLQRECFKLALTLEVLLTVCTLCVLRYGVAVSYVGHPWKTISILLLALMVGGATLLLRRVARRRRGSGGGSSLAAAASEAHSDLLAAQKKLAAYGSLTV